MCFNRGSSCLWVIMVLCSPHPVGDSKGVRDLSRKTLLWDFTCLVFLCLPQFKGYALYWPTVISICVNPCSRNDAPLPSINKRVFLEKYWAFEIQLIGIIVNCCEDWIKLWWFHEIDLVNIHSVTCHSQWSHGISDVYCWLWLFCLSDASGFLAFSAYNLKIESVKMPVA